MQIFLSSIPINRCEFTLRTFFGNCVCRPWLIEANEWADEWWLMVHGFIVTHAVGLRRPSKSLIHTAFPSECEYVLIDFTHICLDVGLISTNKPIKCWPQGRKKMSLLILRQCMRETSKFQDKSPKKNTKMESGFNSFSLATSAADTRSLLFFVFATIFNEMAHYECEVEHKWCAGTSNPFQILFERAIQIDKPKLTG